MEAPMTEDQTEVPRDAAEEEELSFRPGVSNPIHLGATEGRVWLRRGQNARTDYWYREQMPV